MALCTNQDNKTVRLVEPDYLHHYPTFKRVRLAAVKEVIFNPDLPTFRHMDRDTVMCKLCDEHCQTTSCCTPRDFAEAEMNGLRAPPFKFHCLNITETGRELNRMYYTAADVQKGASYWSRYLERGKPVETSKHPLWRAIDEMSHAHLHFDGSTVRLVKPELRNWRLTFRGVHQLDPNGYRQQQPAPSDTDSRHRHAHPIFSKAVSNDAWRDPSRNPEHPNPPRP
ncbi:unnamed protein product [Lymnaea stagnalis]|uniref:Uncharacterized protein n=1 Tax=Lymnaea stagnalis TaxID=6523 RepID=A0AAV2HSU9_LYMST